MPVVFSTFATPIFLVPAVLCAVRKHNKEGMLANITKLSVPRNVARDHAPGLPDVRNDPWLFVVSWLLLVYISESRLCDPVVHAVYSVPMCAFVGLMVPRRPLVADLSCDERALVSCGPVTHRKWPHTASHDTRELQSGPLQTLATETTCLGATSCLSGPSPHLDHSTGE